MFWTRLISGVALVIISFIVLFIGGPVTGIFAMALSLVGVFEFCRVYGIEKRSPAVFAYVWTVLYYVTLMLGNMKIQGFTLSFLVLPIMITYLLAILGVYVFRYPEYHDREIMASFMSFFYVSVMLSYLYKIRVMENGGYYVVLIFLCSWGNDTLAYCTGMLFGKHKMSPKLSPKKSVEGLIGGIIGAGILGCLYGFFLNGKIDTQFNIYLTLFIVCALGAIPAVIGDLAASAIKRNNDVKDYGKLIPGHGGVLDRFDSMIFTAPIIYYLVRLVVG
ncbi:MAG: phosphatidate cytidylyltransferase [Eubacterium sp.]|nr:phosphatidate cytidylyltransferase [Eubacterium sp.]